MTVIDRVATIFFSKKESIAKAIIHSAAIEASVVGLATAQIPGDRFVLGAIQVDMVMRLARVYEKRLDRSGAIAIAKAILAMVAGPEMANQVIKYVPGVGNIANMTVSGSITEAIGWTAVKMFKDGTWFDKSKET
uniref:Uncharacterized conserved protein, DUF697 family n=1 Tax=Candidatus Kentrum sp. MB TaxID=2138164 RepID=A0A451BAJ9_9GAMM|nr:MAG: Uncharacterized conserved protein, DUF697 family [Candidatus Kentron sp. MB]VFK75313.1 MAG: Uncharacterized conserved protein, DUF697 family [Candidatus Kentron sp. MB]